MVGVFVVWGEREVQKKKETRKNWFFVLIMHIFFHTWELEFAVSSFTFGASLMNSNSVKGPTWLVQGLWSFCKVVYLLMLVYLFFCLRIVKSMNQRMRSLFCQSLMMRYFRRSCKPNVWRLQLTEIIPSWIPNWSYFLELQILHFLR